MFRCLHALRSCSNPTLQNSFVPNQLHCMMQHITTHTAKFFQNASSLVCSRSNFLKIQRDEATILTVVDQCGVLVVSVMQRRI
uniref:Uncharacterized protein n=1 Tax=Arundo donax TaxID=35708 RepID=A0A0A9GFK6_ARUDO